ncbi:MAG TPA: M28 family peptidase [Gemmatimonadaceae bacterium]|nr:M28 family peptidase [Gemmatimonadaceae bacterium]
MSAVRARALLLLTAAYVAPIALQGQVVAPLSFGVKSTATVPLIPEPVGEALANELSGSAAKRNLEYITRLHRMRGSKDFRTAAEFVAAQARSYGLSDVKVHEIPADGHTMYGTQKSRPGWDPEFAELWEVRGDSGRTTRIARIASFEDEPVILAEDSDSGDVTAELVDVGDGGSERDYAGKNVRGKLVLMSGPLTDAAALAIDKFGARGMLSDMPNQVTAWWKDDGNLIRWGHLDAFEARRTFAFMLSQKQARALRSRLATGERITMHAVVRASRHPSSYNPVTALIPGTDRRAEEIVLSCHLDHQRPGANDNASGCATILEVGRTLSKLIADGRISRPSRSIRFVWPCEVECTMALFNAEPELRSHFKAVVHMDMVGGAQMTKAVFHVNGSPLSLSTFVNDVGHAFGAFVNEESEAFAAGNGGKYPLVSGEGGKEPLQAELGEFSMGSDNELYTEGSYRIPSIYLDDWPDIYIHTNQDVPANIDATKLQRAAFIGAASALFLANMKPDDVPALWATMHSGALRRSAQMLQRRARLSPEEARIYTREYLAGERAAFESIAGFATIPADVRKAADVFYGRLGETVGASTPEPVRPTDQSPVFARNAAVSGPTIVFGYDYLIDHLHGAPSPRLLSYTGVRGTGADYAYEVLNFVNGKRSARDIRDVVSAEFGPVSLDLVTEYLRALQAAGMVTSAK